MQSATIKINLDGNSAAHYVRILKRQRKYERSSVEMKADRNVITVCVKSKDASALFASMASALKQLKVVSSVDECIEKLSGNERHPKPDAGQGL